MESLENNYTITGGIKLETLVPERVLIIPNRDHIKTWADFGIKVTNQTSTPYRFIFFNLDIELVELEGESIRSEKGNTNRMNIPQESDFLLAQPGETLTFLTKIKYVWRGYSLGLSYQNLSNQTYSFIGLKPTKYWVRFTYRNSYTTRKLHGSRTPWPFSEELWTGIASSPYEEFYLEYPPPLDFRG
ncbi:hypothetical protein [Roseofilum casamattae]|uniref:Uncharacterized protein n=1 Tax=Roseofilum casamattae BLCC-M143 TaxID=3022442 RepID=A0ABT7C2M9_9CYAN|nr:hypothetical protein [Roseofilum casamattae]MDJ1185717.1 hypothetical protein [Roseofilum casamattae BLCC-M143]